MHEEYIILCNLMAVAWESFEVIELSFVSFVDHNEE